MALVVLAAPLSHAEGLAIDAQQRVLAATFEVVQLKPEEGAVTYERPLPMELIPYQQRVDKYRSIGTAFAIGANRFVTAAHVFLLGMGSQFGPPTLRDGAGEVYPIDRVIKYSQDQDFVEFSLLRQPGGMKFLPIADPPPLNSPVFAVGNALGEGIVIRDGMYTSDTPEEADGRWKWLRFSAAASPGNSGGPLVDKAGKAIGIVLRKSESENLNYAVPVRLITAASEVEAIADQRLNLRLPIMDAAESVVTHDRIPLPRPLQDLYAALLTIEAADIAGADARILERNRERVFPQGANSAELLMQVFRSPFPRRIQERQDRVWVAGAPKDIQTALLDHNGSVRYGAGMFQLHAPDDLKLAALYSDSRLFMDLMLRSGYAVWRRIGTDSVKVTSLGKAREEFVHADSYGRGWQMKIWAIPFDDAYIVTMSLPTPEGLVSLIAVGPSGLKNVLVHRQELLSDFVWVTYEGTLSRWREFLELKAVQPQIFSKLALNIDPAYSRVQFHSARFELEVSPDVVGLTPDSVLSLNFGFFRDGATVVWDVGGISVGEGARRRNYLEVRRFQQPGAALPQGFQTTWGKLAAGEFPFNGVAADANGGMRISIAAPSGAAAIPGASPGAGDTQAAVRYALMIQNEGSPGQDVLHAKLEGLQKGFKSLEH